MNSVHYFQVKEPSTLESFGSQSDTMRLAKAVLGDVLGGYAEADPEEVVLVAADEFCVLVLTHADWVWIDN